MSDHSQLQPPGNPPDRLLGGYVVSADPSRLDLAAIQGYLQRSYWADGVPLDVVERGRATLQACSSAADERHLD